MRPHQPDVIASVSSVCAIPVARAPAVLLARVRAAASLGLHCENTTGPGGNPAPSKSFQGAKEVLEA
jgi:hypothetical protein